MDEPPCSGEEDSTFSKVRRYHIDLDIITNEAHSSRLVSIHTTQPWAEITLAQVGVRQRSFLGFVPRAEKLVPGRIIIKEKRRSKVKASALRGTSRQRCR